MQQYKIVEDYLNTVIPEKLSQNKKSELRTEIECHIYDRADFYMEIGYDEDAAFEKAVEQMGEGEEIKAEFNLLYKDSSLKAVLLFFVICAINLVTITHFDLGYLYFFESNLHYHNILPSVAILIIYLAGWVFLTVHTVRCYREKLYKQLMGITAAFGLIAFASLITSGIIFPIFNAGRLIYRYITNGPEYESDAILVIINTVVIGVYAFLCMIKLFSEDKLRKVTYRLSLKQIIIILSVISVCFVVIYGFAYEKYEYNYFGDDAYTEDSKDKYLSNITAEQRNIYAAIKGGDDKAETERILVSNGFIKQDKDYDSYWMDNDYISDQLKKNTKGSDCSIFCYNNSMDEEDEHDDIISCIIIAYDSRGKINYKMFVPLAEVVKKRYYMNYRHGEETQQWLDKLQKGDNCGPVMEFIRSTDSNIIEDEKYSKNSLRNTYMIYLDCYYPFDATFIGFLLGNHPDRVRYSYEIIITAENSILTDCEELYINTGRI